jgi:hypothetical protein
MEFLETHWLVVERLSLFNLIPSHLLSVRFSSKTPIVSPSTSLCSSTGVAGTPKPQTPCRR